ncbi:MAG: NAD-dependent DNA ligase LigA [Puniceicoccales bacterium]|jgi:DNA ligase (NAD+)|nr:NAD-dependent DNA ligase LigA [Puniceicoccales bacterium]
MSELTPREKKKAQKKILQLSAEIDRHDRLYYRDSQPEISDFEYDCLKAELLRLESLFPENSSPEKIGDDRGGILLTRAHPTPMLSLENTYNLTEILNFNGRIGRLLKIDTPLIYVVEPKIDGLAVNLIYEQGQLKYALTRGNGTEGDDVTDNVKTIEGLPLHIENVSDLIEIRGEIYMDQADFQRINRERSDGGEIPFANARNLASGTLKLMDSGEVRSRRLQFIAHGLGMGNNFQRQSEIYPFLERLGFQSQKYFYICEKIGDAETIIRQLDGERKRLPYHTDGVVFKINECLLQKNLGTTAKAPRWAFAYKFEPERAETILRDITFQVGRTGVITPVAELEPVNLSGSWVSRATLHNGDDIEKKDIRIGDRVIVEKSGEIIPAIVAVNLENRKNKALEKFIFPKNCPRCATELLRLPEEVACRCPNENCREQIIQKIIYFASKTAMDIDSLGDAVVRKLVENGKLKTIADLYALHREDLYILDNFGDRSISRLLSNIEHSKKTELWRFINGLGIALVGEKTAKDLANYFSSLDAFMGASVDDLMQIRGVGEKAAQSIVDFFGKEKNMDTIHRILDNGLEFSIPSTVKNPKFSGKLFAITGKLEQYARDEVKVLIEQNGGSVANGINGSVDILIAGAGGGQKLGEAEAKNIPIWSENDFKNALK